MARHRWHPNCDPPDGLVRPVPIDPTGIGGPTRRQARGPRWRQSSYGRYVPADVDPDLPEQRILEQSARLSPGGAVTGWASARLHGARFFDGLRADGRTRIPVPLNPGPLHRLEQDDHCRVSRDRLFANEATTRQGVPSAIPVRALFDEMRYASGLREAVIAMEMMAAAELVSLRQMTNYAELHPAWQGIEQVRRALPLATEGSRSPQETKMRLVWELDAGLPRPLVNQPVFTLEGRLLGYPDIFDEDAGVVGEFDGADHLTALRRSKDVAREEGFRSVGLEYFTVTGRDITRRGFVADRMLAARRRARFLPRDRRLWTLQPPPWWEPEPTLDEILARRALDEELRLSWTAEDSA